MFHRFIGGTCVFGIILVVLLLEAVRRTVGWILLSVILAFLFYGAFGFLHSRPGRFSRLWP